MNDLVLNEECILIGILFKQMILKPSIIKQLATEVNRFSLSMNSNKKKESNRRMDLIYNHHVNVMLIQLIN
jgi:hypothetical protein